MSGEIIKNYTPDRAKHSRVSSELHQQHKSYFCERDGEKAGLTTIKVKLPPWPKIHPLPGHVEECAVVRRGEQFEPANAEEYEKYNHEQAALRPFHLKKNGAGRKPRQVFYPAGERGTKLTFLSLPSYATEALRCASVDEMRALQAEVMVRFEMLCGAKALSSNWHFDTENFHLDLWFAEHDEQGVRYTDPKEYVGVWSAPRSVEVIERYRADNFPVSRRQAAIADAVIDRDRGKKPSAKRPKATKTTKFKCHWNTELGKFLDLKVNDLARKKGLAANIDLYRERWARVARKRAELEDKIQVIAAEAPAQEAARDQELEDLREALKVAESSAANASLIEAQAVADAIKKGRELVALRQTNQSLISKAQLLETRVATLETEKAEAIEDFTKARKASEFAYVAVEKLRLEKEALTMKLAKYEPKQAQARNLQIQPDVSQYRVR